MSDVIPGGIWPPHEAFYLESMLFSTNTAIRASNDVHAALQSGADVSASSTEWQQCARSIIDGIQTIALEAAALSRYFWPARSKEPHASRAARLRNGLGVGERSALRDRALRNKLEHFDEQLDRFCLGLTAGVILPTYVGPMPAEPEVPTNVFRAYYTDAGVFEVLGSRFEIQPLLDAILDLHDVLLGCVSSGYRIPVQTS